MVGGTRIVRWLGLGCGMTLCALAAAEPHPASDDEAAALRAGAERPLRMPILGASARAFAVDDNAPAQRPRSDRGFGVSVVELPAEGPPGVRSRPRHALSINSETPQKMLRSIGIEATDCATRFRMPTKVQRDAYGGSSVNVQAQLGLACRF